MAASRIEMVLLGMILARPGYAYEIDRYINEKHLRRWVRIGSASVYQGLERLARKGLATFKLEKPGRMPARRRYYITEKGRSALSAAVRSILSRSEDHYLDLNLGLFCCHVLPVRELTGLLDSRLGDVEARRKAIRDHGDVLDPSHLWQRDAILAALAEFCQAETRTLKKLINDLRQGQGRTT